ADLGGRNGGVRGRVCCHPTTDLGIAGTAPAVAPEQLPRTACTAPTRSQHHKHCHYGGCPPTAGPGEGRKGTSSCQESDREWSKIPGEVRESREGVDDETDQAPRGERTQHRLTPT